MWSIRQVDNGWELVGPDGQVVLAADGKPWGTYQLALAELSARLMAQLAEADPADAEGDGAPDGLLPEGWVGAAGIAFSEPTGDGRNFTDCTWTWRDPAVSLLPLMLQTETEFGHFGAQLAGFMAEVWLDGTTPQARGRFYDSDAGRQFRDLLLDGRRFGVSVDPGRVEVDWRCTEEDEDGWCIAEEAAFEAYEIIGLTGTPFPAFAEAAIQLETVQASAEPAAAAGGGSSDPAAVRAAMGFPAFAQAASAVRTVADPPAELFAIAEPELGQPFHLGDLGDEWLVDQGHGALAMPLTITEPDADGQVLVLGHLAYWGQCHVGYEGICVTPPDSAAAYAHFHTGEVRCADGSRLPTGVLVAGCDHAATTLRAPEARDHYAHNGVGWADVRVTSGTYGPWVAGVARPDVTPEQLRVLRASSLSGDWRRIGGGLELISGLAVNTPGFPISREAIVASGLGDRRAQQVQTRVEDGVQVALIASGIVRRCAECARRGAQARRGGAPAANGHDPRIDQVLHQLGVIERRTRHLAGAEAEHVAARIRRG